MTGDWAETAGCAARRLGLPVRNAYYPDLDDTAVVVMALDRAATCRIPTSDAWTFAGAIAARGMGRGLQSRNGGWGAFDADNTYYYLNNIPFADHGALLDPPTEDVAARCVGMLAQLGRARTSTHRWTKASLISCARRSTDGSWFGRWGVNYIYGTWSALAG